MAKWLESPEVKHQAEAAGYDIKLLMGEGPPGKPWYETILDFIAGKDISKGITLPFYDTRTGKQYGTPTGPTGTGVDEMTRRQDETNTILRQGLLGASE